MRTRIESPVVGLALPVVAALSLATLALGCESAEAAPATGAKIEGKQVFQDNKCDKCHSAPGVKGGEQDLKGVGAKHEKSWMKKYLVKDEQLDGKKHKKKFNGTDAELDALVEWLASLK